VPTEHKAPQRAQEKSARTRGEASSMNGHRDSTYPSQASCQVRNKTQVHSHGHSPSLR
jgi:hypothetical protein